jgi:hypothetical protein
VLAESKPNEWTQSEHVKLKANRHFGNKREYLKDKICVLETNVRTKVLQISIEA